MALVWSAPPLYPSLTYPHEEGIDPLTRQITKAAVGDSAPPIAVLALNPAVDMTYEIPNLVSDQKVHAHSTDPAGYAFNQLFRVGG